MSPRPFLIPILFLLASSLSAQGSSILTSKSVTSNLPGEPCTESVEACVPYWREILEKRGSIQAHLHISHPDEQNGAAGASVTVSRVTPGGPGDRSGLRSGDRVLAINGVEMGSDPSAVLDGVLAEFRVGEEVVYRIRREGKEQELKVTTTAPLPSVTDVWLFFCIAETFGIDAASRFAAEHGVTFSGPPGSANQP